MKAKRFLTLFLTLAMILSTVSIPAVSVSAANDNKMLIDTNKKSSITDAGLTADKKNAKTTGYAAKWVVDDYPDLRIEGIPTDFSKYNTLNFSVMLDSSGPAEIMVYFGSENPALDGIDYYSYTLKLTPGTWQDVSIKYGDLAPMRTPLGWNQMTELSFRTIGWSNKAEPKSVVYFENMYLSGAPVENASNPDIPQENLNDKGEIEENKTKLFYKNNYDGDNANIAASAAVVPKSNTITHEIGEDGNGYVNVNVTADKEDCYFEASLKTTKVNNLVVELDVSTASQAPTGNLQYKDNSAARTQGTLFSINASGEIVVGSEVIKEIKKDKWVKLAFVINFEKSEFVLYADGKKVGTYGVAKTLNDVSMMRMYVNQGADNVGKSLLIDNFNVYGGTELRDVSNEEVAGGTAGAQAVAKVGTDVEMVHPSVDDINGGVALMIDKSDAYANGKLTKIDAENEKVVPVIIDDRTLVPVRFIAESFGADVGWNADTRTATVDLDGKHISIELGKKEMTVDGNVIALDVAADVIQDRTMLPLRAVSESLGKNVLWDTRRLIVITNADTKLDAEKDVKLSTMLIGLLETGVPKQNYAVTPNFTQAIIDEACATKPGGWTSAGGNSGTGEKCSNILYYLTLAARFDPNAASSNGTLCKDVAVEYVRKFVAGGNEPFACVGCYWGHAVFASAMLLVKNTPVVYDELTADEKERMDWLMRGLAIAGNWGYNDKNNYSTGFDLMGNFGKGWNPNFTNTYLSIVLTSSLYFGAEELNEIYTSFDYDTYIKKYEEYGFTNILATWTVAGKDLMENGGDCTLLGGIGLSYMEAGQPGGTGAGVKIPFLYDNKGPEDIDYIFKKLLKLTYAYNVISEYGTPGTSDHTYILSGAKSPFEGQMGMMLEFASTDGGDGKGSSNIRSRTGYGYDSYEILVSVYANMKLFGGWDSSTKEMRELDNRVFVGNEDLLFKMEEGYHGYSSGKASDEYEHEHASRGAKFVKDVWKNFHCMLNEEVALAPNPNDPNAGLPPLPEAGPKDGITSAPAGAFPAVLLSNLSTFADASYYPIGENLTSGTVEFDIVLGENVMPDMYDSVVMLDKKTENATWGNANMLIQFTTGTVKIRNGGEYKPTTLRFASNYRYHVKLTFDVPTRKYTVEIGEIYPNVSEVYKAEGYDFRMNAKDIDYVDSLCIVNSNAESIMWVENFKVVK